VTITGNKARLVVGALILSVCLNVFGAALYGATHFWRGERRGPEAMIARLIERAPEEAQPALRASFATHEAALTERFAEVRAAREAVRTVLSSGEADAEALQSAFAEMRARWTAAAAEMDAIIIEAVPQMPPEARTTLAERWGKR
jgi:uncharacterized membrane protein